MVKEHTSMGALVNNGTTKYYVRIEVRSESEIEIRVVFSF
jgi:hypothetical protein